MTSTAATPSTPSTPIRAETWDDLAQLFGVFRSSAPAESKPSVELTVDSKGMVKASVKVYADDAYTAMHTAEDVFNQLRTRYGF